MNSLWTADDQKMLAELVRKRGMADVCLGLRQIAYGRERTPDICRRADWMGIAGLLTRIYDNIKERRPVND